MKKSLVALAALAATAAFAQSSVTLYGIADAYVGQTKFEGGPTQTVVNSGGLSQSRIGLSVKEDLGAGLNAFAVVEYGIDLDGGNNNNGQQMQRSASAVRTSIVGLSGSFGKVALGAQQSPLSDVLENVLDAQSNSVFSSVTGAQPTAYTDGGRAFGGADYTPAMRNMVRYDTPNFDGFTAAIQLGLGENKDMGWNFGRADRDTSFNVQYANGPLAVALGHEMNETTTGKDDRLTMTALAGSYDFSVVKLNLGLTNTKMKNVSGNDKGISVGLTAPIGAFTVIGQITRNKASDDFAWDNFAGNGDKSRTSFGLEGRYALSKRTTSYVGFNQTKDNNLDEKSRVFGVGVRHVF